MAQINVDMLVERIAGAVERLFVVMKDYSDPQTEFDCNRLIALTGKLDGISLVLTYIQEQMEIENDNTTAT